jgi:hypothetical protein
MLEIKLTMILFLQESLHVSDRIPSDADCHDLKCCFSVLDDNSSGMRDVKAYYDGQLMVRAAAVERDIAREPVDDWRTFINLYKDEDRRNQTRIDEQHTSHFMEGASWNNEYHIPGAGAPFERLFFQARDALDKVTDELAFERKDRAYEREYRDEWEDFDCINGLLDSQNKLRIAREDLESERYQSQQLRSEVQRLSEEVKRLKQGPD